MADQDYIPRRVVSLQPSATVTLTDIGMLDRLVACTKWCAELCPAIMERPIAVVSDSWSVQTQEILAARPDLVIASVPYREAALAAILKSGARFLGLAPRLLADVYADIAAIAGLMQAPERGRQVIAGMQKEIEAVRQRTRTGFRPIVFCEEWGKPLITSQGWVAELVEAAGGQFLGIPGSTTDPETIRAADPDVVVAAWCGTGERVPLEKIVRERGWSESKAAREARVYCIKDDYLNTPASTLIHGLHALSAAIEPEKFPMPRGMRRIALAMV